MPAYSGQIADRFTYITPDNQEFMLSSPWYVMSEDGLGMPPLEYITQRGPFQDGESVVSVWARPRTIQLMVRREACSRPEYWNLRTALINAMRPNRVSDRRTPGLLRKFMANGRTVEWLVYPSQGPGFPPGDQNSWDQFAIQDTIRFTAYDPIARNPIQQTFTFASSGVVGTFPITFPYQFASFGSNSTIPYSGNWDAFPTITLNGPLTSPLVRNLTTGEKIALNTSIASGRTVTVVLDYGNKSITLDDGTNLIGFASADSDIGSFHLQPGDNNMQIFATGTSGISAVVLRWFDRVIGV